jgi:hypothetical protein
MRSIKYVAALGATLVVSLGSVAGASAHKFRASTEGGKVESRATTEQVFTGLFGAKVECKIAAGTGTSKLNSETQEVQVSYSECKGGEPVNPAHYKFNADGEVEIQQPIEIKKTLIGTCTVEKQTRSGITFTTLGTEAAKDREIQAVADVEGIKTTSCGSNTYTGTDVTKGVGFEVWFE